MKAKEVTSTVDLLASFADKLQTKSSLTYKPHPKQQEFHCSYAKEKQFIGGNRSGKTVASVLECIWRLTKTHPFRPDLNAISEPIRGRLVCVSFVEGLEAIILPLFKEWLPIKYLKDRSWEKSYNGNTRRLTLEDGSFIEFMSYEQDTEKFAGTSRHFIAFDEEPPLIIWEECILRVMDTDGDWWIAMTPVEGATWTYKKIWRPWSKGERPHTLVIQVNTTENPFISQTAYERTMSNLGEEDKAARSEGAYNFDSSLVYPNFSDETHILESFKIPTAKDAEWLVYTSLDSGWAHPAAWLWHAVHVSGRIVTFHEIVLAKTTVSELARQVLAYEKENNITVHLRTGDPALLQTREITGTSIETEYAKHGIFINVRGVPRGAGSVDNGINKVTQYLDGRIKVKYNNATISVPTYMIFNCPKLVDEFENYRWAKHASRKIASERAPKKEPEKKDDDAIDSLRYFVTLQDDLTPDKLEQMNQILYYINGELVSNYPNEYLAGYHQTPMGATVYEELEESWY